jgi:CDP-glycerol glycerophosphotransferase (TagB/SpsB family)
MMDSITLANTLAHTDVLINVASTITLEACILNKPVVNIGFDGRSQREYFSSVRRYFDYVHYRNMLKTGGVRVAFTKDELVQIVNTYLEDNSIDAEGRKEIVELQCYRMDGKALERILEFIVSFVKERTKPLIVD